MKKGFRTAVAAALGCCLLTVNVPAATVTFTDVTSSNPLYSFITRAAGEGLISGTGNGKYDPSSPLQNAQFISMVCKLFYQTEVDAFQNTYQPTNNWWRSCMEVANTKKLLTGTTVGDSRQTAGAWNISVVESPINRYDMAQIIHNLSTQQGFSAPTAAELNAARNRITDWDQIPAKYQTAVSSAYARGYLSGMSDGTFSGSSSFLRDQGAVVLCRLLDAKGTISSPTYTNTTNLVNGKAPTEENVVSALTALQKEFPKGYVWDVRTLYQSPVLGRSKGSEAFAYMLADRVFGNLGLTATTAEKLKPGDVILFSSSYTYAVVTDVYNGQYDYVSCTSNGSVSWTGHGNISDLTKQDVIYSRYKGTGSYSSASNSVLSDGSAATEKNVSSLLDTFERKRYGDGDVWDDSYSSAAFSSKKFTGSQGFAYYLSDYIFGDLPISDTIKGSKSADVQVGDVIYLYEEDLYGVVTGVSSSKIDYVTVDSWDEVDWSNSVNFSNLTTSDRIYTRYPDGKSSGSSSSGNSKTGTLTNGKSATESNVSSLLKTFLAEEYGDGDTWKDTETYKSTAFSKNSVKGNQAFAYYLSDYIFGDLDVETTSKNDLRVGDVVYKSDWGEYLVVTSVPTTSSGSLGYVETFNGKVDESTMKFSDLTSSDKFYTRYPDGGSSSGSNKTDTLSNGKSATESNVSSLLKIFQRDEYSDGDSWSTTKTYKSTPFSSKTVKGSQAFAYYLSDYIFDSLEVSKTNRNNLRVGDVVYIYDWDEYVVVTSVSSSSMGYIGASNGKVYTDTMKLSGLGSQDLCYTRYPSGSSGSSNRADRLADGSTITAKNVANLLSDVVDDMDDVSTWSTTKSYSTSLFGSCKGAKAFADDLSDQVFGDLDSNTHTDPDDLKVGDVILLDKIDHPDSDYTYIVVLSVTGTQFTFAGVDRYNDVTWDSRMRLDKLTEYDTIYTRY